MNFRFLLKRIPIFDSFNWVYNASNKMLRRSSVVFFREETFSWYQSQMLTAETYLKKSKTYPGSLKAASPGNALCYYSKYPRREILPERERHYWRAVIDDPDNNTREVTLRMRFYSKVWVLGSWEQRLHYQMVTVPHYATLEQVKQKFLASENVKWDNLRSILFIINGKELATSLTLSEVQDSISSRKPSTLTLDVVESGYEDDHLPSKKKIDFNEDEVSPDEEESLLVKEMHKVPHEQARPRQHRPFLKF